MSKFNILVLYKILLFNNILKIITIFLLTQKNFSELR